MYKDSEGKWWILSDKESGAYQDFRSWSMIYIQPLVLVILTYLKSK